MSKHLFSDIRIPIEADNPAIRRIEERCIKCGQCRRVCENEIAVGRLYGLESTGDVPICVHCGQCANACPVDSITEVYEYPAVREMTKRRDKIVVFNTSPSVRVSLGEAFGLPAGSFVEGKMVAALRAPGGGYVLDTNFAADLTVMEEAAELVERLTGKKKPLPQFTSCCPAWVKFVETFYPEFLPNISSVKSPIGMQGPTVKTYFAEQNGIDPRRIVNVAVTLGQNGAAKSAATYSKGKIPRKPVRSAAFRPISSKKSKSNPARGSGSDPPRRRPDRKYRLSFAAK